MPCSRFVIVHSTCQK